MRPSAASTHPADAHNLSKLRSVDDRRDGARGAEQQPAVLLGRARHRLESHPGRASGQHHRSSSAQSTRPVRLIRRLPHQPLNPDRDGIRIAVFYTKIYNRFLIPLTAANQHQAHPASGPR